MRKPQIYADRLIIMIEKALNEFFRGSEYILKNKDLFDTHDQIQIHRMYGELFRVYQQLIDNSLRGDPALDECYKICIKYSRVSEELAEGGTFPEFFALYSRSFIRTRYDKEDE